ncbi:MAG: uracil-DNA glycosylase [Acidobacteriota bacterium]
MSDFDEPLRQLARQLEFFAELGIDHLKIGTREGRCGSEEDMVLETEPPAAPGNSAAALAAIREDLGDCTRCKLHPLRKNIVFGEGDPQADLMFVGEAPGADEDRQGRPFVGRAGQLLTRIIQAMGLKREDVYIANIIKCRPPNNRDPEADEIAACEPFLFRQIDAIRPLVIVALGRYAAQTLLRTSQPISQLRGKLFAFRDSLLLPTFHPSYLLRNPAAKKTVWEDMKQVMRVLEEKGSRYYRKEGGSRP